MRLKRGDAPFDFNEMGVEYVVRVEDKIVARYIGDGAPSRAVTFDRGAGPFTIHRWEGPAEVLPWPKEVR